MNSKPKAKIRKKQPPKKPFNQGNLFPSHISEAVFSSYLLSFVVVIFPYIFFILGHFVIKNLRSPNSEGFWIGFWNEVSQSTDEVLSAIVTLFVILFIWAFINWKRKIPFVFMELFNEKRLVNRNENPDGGVNIFISNYQKSLFNNKKRFTFVIIFWIFILIYKIIVPWMAIRYLFTLLYWGLLAGLIIWPIFIIGRTISNLKLSYKLNIQPDHPDKCGGLKELGDFCFLMVQPLLIGGIFLAIIGLGGTIISALPAASSPIIKSFQSLSPEKESFLAYLALFFIILPIITTSFFAPLWDIHQQMIEKKKDIMNDFANQKEFFKQEIIANLKNENELDKAKKAKEKYEILQVIHPDKIAFPLWPFPRITFFKIFSPHFIAIIGLFWDIYEKIGT